MPTILRIGSSRFFFFSNKRREPPHVHVQRGARRTTKRSASVGMTTSARNNAARAVSVSFDADMLAVTLDDGREIRAPVDWFPRLRAASAEQRRRYELIAGGIGIHWPY